MDKIKDPIVTVNIEAVEVTPFNISYSSSAISILVKKEKELCYLLDRRPWCDYDGATNVYAITPSEVKVIARETVDCLIRFGVFNTHDLCYEEIKREFEDNTWSKAFKFILFMAAYDLMREHDFITCEFDGCDMNFTM